MVRHPYCRAAAIAVLTVALAVGAPARPAGAQGTPSAAPPGAAPGASPTGASPAVADAGKQTVRILLAREKRDVLPPLSLLDLPPADDGLAGAKLGIADNNTTGRFLKQEFQLEVVEKEKPEDLVAEIVGKVGADTGFVIADAAAATILALADALKDKGAVVLNASAPDENLREEDCRVNLKHVLPSRSMLTDALAQYLAWKRWTKWFVIAGELPGDKAYVEALRRSAKRFGATIVEERTFKSDTGSRRTDGGFEQVQQQIPSFTQNAKPHDVVVVADEGELFGEYIPFRTWDPRPVAGTAGLVAQTWHPAIELWGGTQFQNRFRRMANRPMRPLDYNMWLAIRAIGEAASRTRSADAGTLARYMNSPEFELAAFKGVKTTFRTWNGQLRQPIPVTTPKLLVTVSPQPGFLHQVSELDTLGFDKPETKCKAYTAK